MADDQLILASAGLARGAPELWRQFVRAMEIRANQCKDAAIQATPENTYVLQGHAREMVHLLKTFNSCLENADKIKNNQSRRE